MGTKDCKPCKCGATPVVAKTNKGQWRVMGPCCQRFDTRDHGTREEAIIGWNENIEKIGKKKTPAKKDAAKK